MKNWIVFTGLILSLAICANLEGCDGGGGPALPEHLDWKDPVEAGKADWQEDMDLPIGFPQAQDLAILIPMEISPAIRADLSTRNGGVLLSADWLDQVSDSYLGTDVEDALEVENWYEEWQVVSVRIAPCGPLGHFPGHLPNGVCWPQVRIVWQPVVEDFMLFGFTKVDRYADDRAVHALYRVHPHADGGQISASLEAVLAHIESGAPVDNIHPQLKEDFLRDRNLATKRLVADVAGLRSMEGPQNLWSPLDVRAEYYANDEIGWEFHQKLYGLLWKHAQPWALHELTSFSLPEGRNPAGIDSWVFVAFEGARGEIIQKDITVRSRNTGKVLANLGLDQTVTGEGEDDALLEAMQNPSVAGELAQHVFLQNEDADEFGDIIADPNQTFVSNTSCATCHRLTELSFDFHTYSYFEDRDATISPRVEMDVANDLHLMRVFIEGVDQ